jgi:ferredoxin-type protein NapF
LDGAARKRRAFSFSIPVAKLPPIGRWVALLTFGGALFGYPFLLWLDPLAIFHGVFTLSHDPLDLAGQVSAVLLGVVLSISLLLPGAWCTRLCPLGATQDLLAMPQRLFRRRTSPTDQPSTDERGLLSRRTAFSAALGAVCLGLGGRFAPAAATRTARDRSPLLRPPGSLDEGRFVGSCLRCGNCIRVCPSGIIQPDLGYEGIAGFLAPKVSFDDEYCREDCHRCTQICPSGAIAQLTLEEKNKAPIGVAKLEAPLCLLWDDGECDLCKKVCPFQAITIDWDPEEYVALPVVHKDKCPGCGACELMCPGTNKWERDNSDEPIPVRKAIVVKPQR